MKILLIFATLVCLGTVGCVRTETETVPGVEKTEASPELKDVIRTPDLKYYSLEKNNNIHYAGDIDSFTSTNRQVFADARKYVDGHFFNQLPAARSPKCDAEMKNLYVNTDFRIRFALGYWDRRPDSLVIDQRDRDLLVEEFTRTCEGSEVLCGMKITSDDDFSTILEKPFKNPFNVTKNMVITITTSSVDGDDDFNRTDNKAKQNEKSLLARSEYYKSFFNDDVVFYWGHNRTGGGSDFFLPQLLPKSKEVDYAHYRKKQIGTKLIDAALAQDGRRVRVVGMLSCESDVNMKAIIPQASDVTFMISTVLIYDYDQISYSMALLSSLISGNCASDVVQNVYTQIPSEDHSSFTITGPLNLKN